ncbi:DUF1641 domain-containing protein [Pantoea sp. FN060301]|uniref:DUF1641 domain-containing protein n=1 Tax=Pantoea sp. FN060301 TaxID=3420380 RepID=UPI003D17C8FD
MAERMNYEVPPTRTEPNAGEALNTLLENLHKHGFIRLANDLVCANTDIAKVLVSGLNRPGSQAAIQNISLLMMALSRMPPERFNQLLMALTDGVNALSQATQDEQKQRAPGITGIIRLLRDDEFWQGISPLLSGLRAFSTSMEKSPDKPISRYSGKESHA